MSGLFAAVGLAAAWWVFSRTNNFELASGIFYFFTMELLQAIQYLYIASSLDDTRCDTFINKFLTLLGFLHICFQPYFCHVINSSLTKSCKHKDRYKVIKRMCLIGGFLLFIRYFLSFIPELRTMQFTKQTCQGGVLSTSTEWLRGDSLCTFKTQSMYHLGWSVPMADPSYYVMGASIHSFLMFAPFLVLYEKKGMIIQGFFLFMFGPVLAAIISDNLMEQASIWCFFSIAQISIMLFLIRETLLVNWGKGNVSVVHGPSNNDNEDVVSCRDFINCEYCNAENERRQKDRERKAYKID
eukprot:gene7764-10549_t